MDPEKTQLVNYFNCKSWSACMRRLPYVRMQRSHHVGISQHNAHPLQHTPAATRAVVGLRECLARAGRWRAGGQWTVHYAGKFKLRRCCAAYGCGINLKTRDNSSVGNMVINAKSNYYLLRANKAIGIFRNLITTTGRITRT